MTHFVNQHIMGVAETVSNHPKWSRLVDLVKDLAFIDGGDDNAFTQQAEEILAGFSIPNLS